MCLLAFFMTKHWMCACVIEKERVRGHARMGSQKKEANKRHKEQLRNTKKEMANKQPALHAMCACMLYAVCVCVFLNRPDFRSESGLNSILILFVQHKLLV